ncbi:MAG: PTS transporter subunit EIIB, partial [Cetobacterium sp.]
MNYNKIGRDILKEVGGTFNVKELTYCFTRLRFVLKDLKLVDKKRIEQLEGVISVIESGGQLQVVIGSKVEKIYLEIVPILSQKDEVKKEENKNESLEVGNIWNRILIAISTI